jgi:hypothetical protein
MRETTGPVDMALTEVGEDELFVLPIVGQAPKLNENWAAQCGWLVHLDEEGKIQHLCFHSTPEGVEESPEDRAELRAYVRQQPYDDGFDSRFIVGILREARARTAAFLVKLVNDLTHETVWMIYHHPVLDPEHAQSLLLLSIKVVEAEEAAAQYAAYMEGLTKALDDALGLKDQDVPPDEPSKDDEDKK